MDDAMASMEEDYKRRFETAAAFVQGILHPVMADGSYSFGFLAELATMSFTSQETVLRIAEEIRLLEQGAEASLATKPATAFTGPHLVGYWHKHYCAAAFIPENLRLEMRRDDTVDRVWGKYSGQTITQEHVDELVHSLVRENLEARTWASRLTGEWLVFSMAEGKRTFLTLAKHAEGDQAIAERIHRHESIDSAAGWDWRTSRFTFAPGPS